MSRQGTRVTTPAGAIEQMRAHGITPEVIGGTVILSGGNRHVRAVWQPVVRRMRRELVAMLAPPVAPPAQLELVRG